ncbi:MAG: HEAT repeat domain-containing protein [Pirellulales bacterium]
MLDKLDEIDWHQLTHAYGPADDVPDLLRALLSQDKKKREETSYELFSNIWHQGTVYEATIYAVPFLIELLSDPSTPDKTDIAVLIACIVDGRGYLEVHARPELFKSDWTKILSKQKKDLNTELLRELDITNQVREATKCALPLLLPYLSDPDSEVRGCISPAFAAFPDLADAHLPILEHALSTEQNDEVREKLEEAIKRLRDTGEN